MDVTRGTFLGSTLVQQSGSIGGSKFVFVKLQGEKNELVFPTFGGQIYNPFKGKAKIYAGDLFEYKTNDKGYLPKIYILKTYKVIKTNENASTTIYFERNGYRHVPFVGDCIMAAPAVIGGTGTAVKVTAVAEGTTTVGTATVDCWTVTVSAALACNAGDVFVESEAVAAGSSSATKAMLVKNINAVAACDYEFFFDGVADPNSLDDDFVNAKYFMTPALGGLMYKHKMSPLPACVEALNQCNVNGWFKVDALSANAGAPAAALAGKVRYLEGTSAPANTVAGNVGDIIVLLGNSKVYVCTAAGDTYTWATAD